MRLFECLHIPNICLRYSLHNDLIYIFYSNTWVICLLVYKANEIMTYIVQRDRLGLVVDLLPSFLQYFFHTRRSVLQTITQ